MEMPTKGSEPNSEREPTPVLGIKAVETSGGWVGLALSQQGLVALRYPVASCAQALEGLAAAFPGAEVLGEDAWPEFATDLIAYFRGKPVQFRVTFDLADQTPFQRQVWEATLQIPYGETRSYAWVAAEIGAPRAFRAVGAALKANPIPIVIPCHRVLRSDGSLGGYAGGQSMKQRLLALEKRVAFGAVRELV